MDFRFKLGIIGTVVELLIFGVLTYIFYQVAAKFDAATILLWAAVVTALIFCQVPFWVLVGMYFGKTEVRGFMSGSDIFLEKVFARLVDVVNVRDQSKIHVRNAAPEAQSAAPVYLFRSQGRPEITDHGSQSAGGQRPEVIDLD